MARQYTFLLYDQHQNDTSRIPPCLCLDSIASAPVGSWSFEFLLHDGQRRG